jgi:hypothetical protein
MPDMLRKPSGINPDLQPDRITRLCKAQQVVSANGWAAIFSAEKNAGCLGRR